MMLDVEMSKEKETMYTVYFTKDELDVFMRTVDSNDKVIGNSTMTDEQIAKAYVGASVKLLYACEKADIVYDGAAEAYKNQAEKAIENKRYGWDLAYTL